MRSKLFILFVLIAKFSFSQQSLTKEQINRLADAGKIYGYIKYFHPYLQYKTINWDSAFASNIPNIMAARNKTEYENSMTQLFTVLNDPMTVVIKQNGEVQQKKPLSYSIQDSILIIDMTDYSAVSKINAEPSAVITKAFENLDKIKGVIFDLRWDQNFLKDINDIQEAFDYGIRIEKKLLKSNINCPSFRTVGYNGFPAEASSARTYDAFFQQHAKALFRGGAAKDIPTVFIVNQYTSIPEQALAMQENEKAVIIQEENIGDISGQDIKFYITDSVMVKMRIGELVNKNGSIGLNPETTYNSKNPSSAFDKAKQILQKGFVTDVKTNYTPDPPIVQIVNYSKEGIYPSLGFRVLAAAKIFTVIDHFYPNKKLMDNNWDEMYLKFLPDFINAKDSIEYYKAAAAFYTNINDGHGFGIGNGPWVNKINNGGWNQSPVNARIIGNDFVVTSIINDSAASAIGITKGDVILTINSKRPIDLINEVRQYVPASNRVTQTHYISDYLLMGDENGSHQLKIKDAYGKIKDVVLPTSGKLFAKEYFEKFNVRYDKPMLRFITKDIGYVDLDRLKQTEVDSMFTMFRDTKAIIFDMRGYPSATALLIAPRLTNRKDVVAAKITLLTPSSPNINAIGWMLAKQHTLSVYQKLPLSKGWIYKGKTVMLMDEYTQSQGENTGLLFKAANNTTFIGSQTAGANGDVSNFTVPGRMTLGFSGLNVAYPNGETMQRVGLNPDVYVRPTIKGIQLGEDEVLERAVKFLQTGK